MNDKKVGHGRYWEAESGDGIPDWSKEEGYILDNKNKEVEEYVLDGELMGKEDENGDLYLEETISYCNKDNIKKWSNLLGINNNQVVFRKSYFDKQTEEIEAIKLHDTSIGKVGDFNGYDRIVFE
jgi:hypothetical protein